MIQKINLTANKKSINSFYVSLKKLFSESDHEVMKRFETNTYDNHARMIQK